MLTRAAAALAVASTEPLAGGVMIAPDREDRPDAMEPVALLRKDFALPGEVRSAALRVTARGIYRAEINGTRVGDEELAPGWTSYHGRLTYQTHDVTALVRSGSNAIGVQLADGWWRGYLSFTCTRNTYGSELGLLAELVVETTEGTVFVGTDDCWRSGTGPVLEADLYMGERYDARIGVDGWSCPGFDDSGWAGCHQVELDRGTLVPATAPPVRVTGEVTPVALLPGPDGAVIVDLGQNLVGRVRLTGIDVPEGTEITLRHAEVLHDGELATSLLRGARQTDTYVAAGTGDETWEPAFTTHGFRYVEVSGWPSIGTHNLSGRVLHTDLERTGWFHCSDPLLQQLHDNAVWSLRGNTVSVPTDCPQRDERLGWTGDIQVFAPSAAFLYDVKSFLESWLEDLLVDQAEDGGIPWVVPNILDTAMGVAAVGVPAAWADAAVVVPWVLYERYGDDAVLRRHYDSMSRFVRACVAAHGPELSAEVFQFGDWCDPDAPITDAKAGKTEPLLVAGAYLVRSADLTANAARVIGEDPAEWEAVASSYREVWQSRFLTDEGRCTSDAATAYALAICFDLLPDQAATRRAGDRLAELCAAAGHRITTGFVGTPLVCDALQLTGHLDEAYAVLTARECPSFLYPVLQGATTIWERWDSLKPDGTLNSAVMTSFNHYALGAVVDWMHRTVGGLAPASPGYQRIRVAPRPGAGLTHAGSRLHTRYGLSEVAWRLDRDHLVVDVQVPPGTTAVVDLPTEGWRVRDAGPGAHTFAGRLSSA